MRCLLSVSGDIKDKANSAFVWTASLPLKAETLDTGLPVQLDTISHRPEFQSPELAIVRLSGSADRPAGSALRSPVSDSTMLPQDSTPAYGVSWNQLAIQRTEGDNSNAVQARMFNKVVRSSLSRKPLDAQGKGDAIEVRGYILGDYV